LFLWILQKKRCWACGSLNVIKWGKQLGKQRYKCKDCAVLSTASNKGVSAANRFPWFKEWVIGRQTIAQLSAKSGYSERTLKRYFYQYLSEVPVFTIRPSEKVNLLIDATYFSNNLCLVLYRDNTIKYTQLYRLTDGEWYDEIKEDLENLVSMGVQIESITCDGHKSLLKAIRKVCKHVIIQRCLVHIQRMCRIWLTAKPKSEAGNDLKSLVNKLHTIKTHTQRDYWLVNVIRWYEQYEDYIKEKSFAKTGRYWYKHKLLRRSFTVIRRALPDMFHYLDNIRIPKSTNGIESFFGHLKSHITVHRGLSRQHRRNFIKWYLYFRNQ
jgi:AraC-like DNA-binding protein